MSKPTVLVVDDDQVSLVLLSKLVEKLNYQVVVANSGRQALEILAYHNVDLVISDYEMPEMNGLELLQQMKVECPDLPVILVTAYSNLKVIRSAWDLGAFDFFEKPIFVERLNQTIRLAIDFGHLTIARRKFHQQEVHQPNPDLINIGIVRELAAAIDREDLMVIVEEFEVHTRIELEQMIRFSLAKNSAQVKSLAHRLWGTSINLGLVKLAENLRWIEDHPHQPIKKAADLEQSLENSVYWLKHYLAQIFHDLAG